MPADQAWFWTEQWQRREREVNEHVARGEVAVHESTDDYAGRPAKPTGRLIFTALSRLRLIPTTHQTPPVIPEPPPLQANILQLLGVDPTQPR